MQNTLSNVSFGSEKDGFHDETVHFIWAGYEANDHCFRKSGYRAEIIQIFYKVMMEHGIDKPFMITFLWRMRVKCETKEDYETAHYSPCHINTPWPWGTYGTDNDKDSIGDHLENFITDLKNNKYCFENAGLDSMDTNGCFHFAMLTDQEEKEIQNPDSDFLVTFPNLNPDVPKTEMAKSDSKHKYVRSFCVRSTYII